VATLLSRVASRQRLAGAWETIHASAIAEDRLSEPLKRFARSAPDQITALSDALSAGTYIPQILHHADMPKPDGDVRALDIPSVRDRIVERAIVEVVEPYTDPYISCAAVGFRAGLGVADAVQRIVQARDEGLLWVLRTDFNDCFPSIPQFQAAAALLRLLPDRTLDTLIAQLLARRTQERGRTRVMEGLAQGSALSPLLSNLVLSRVDDALLDRGFPVVRYADDMTVVCSSRAEAEQALAIIGDAVKELGMSLEQAKTEIMDFSTGFSFLGEDFGPFYPPVQADHRLREPLRKTLYVARQGSRVWIKRGRVVVTTKDDVDVLSVPTSHVGALVLFGAVGLSAGVRSWLLQQGIHTVFASRTGSYLGLELPANSKGKLSRWRAQLRVTDDAERSLVFGRAVVAAKIRHQITVLQRFNTRDASEYVAQQLGLMRQMLGSVPNAADRSELMGVEGAAAKAYFASVSSLLPEPLRFDGRSRRPPMDVFNAALGYGYAILLGECVTALTACGLEPGLGMLHADDDSRPSLALDLMEEFRPYVVDQVVVSLCRKGGLKAEDGVASPGTQGVYLSKSGKEAVVNGYERRMLQVTRGALAGFSGSIRRHVYRQAQHLAQFIMGQQDDWTGLSWR